MGSMIGHVTPGISFLLIGLWHLLNHIKLHALYPKTYTSLPWFPTSRYRYFELYLIMAGCLGSISMELFIGPSRHQPLDLDGTIPSYHLRNFEHANISLGFFIYAFFSIILDKIKPPAQYGLNLLLAAIAFGQQLMLFHLHSSDHVGVEGQYHLVFQIVIFVSFVTSLLGIGYPKSFLNSFVRSFSIMFQGVWFMVIGVMLWTPEYIPKGCYLIIEDGRKVVKCHDQEAVERAKSLVNIQFSWYVSGLTVFAVAIYLALIKVYPEQVEYHSLAKLEWQEKEVNDLEGQKREAADDMKQ